MEKSQLFGVFRKLCESDTRDSPKPGGFSLVLGSHGNEFQDPVGYGFGLDFQSGQMPDASTMVHCLFSLSPEGSLGRVGQGLATVR